MQNVVDVIRNLPQSIDIPFCVSPPPGIRYVSRANPRFVAPPLRTARELEDGTVVVLLSSPAAVGKSTVAAEIAYGRGAPVWDLSKARVGTGSFQGVLVQALGPGAYDFMEGLRSGNALLVVDALDEGQLRVGGASFDEFLGDVCSFFHSTSPAHPTLLLLGRSEAALWVSLWLEQEQVPYAHYELDFFTHDQAVEFIEKWLDDQGHRSHRDNSEPFREACATLFGRIRNALGVADQANAWQNAAVRTFLGYAPVLECVARYLCVENYSRLGSDLANAAISDRETGVGHLLEKFIQELMIREQREKVVPAIRQRLTSVARRCGGWDKWDTLYGHEEQLWRVLNAVQARGQQRCSIGSVPRSDELPAQLATDYEEAIEGYVQTHPFVGPRETRGFAGVVFEEYAYAWMIASHPDQFGALLEQRFREEGYLPSPLLSWFYLGITAGRQGDPRIHASLFGALYESLRASEGVSDKAGAIDLAILQREPETEPIALISGIRGATDAAELRIAGAQAGPLVLWRQLAYAYVDVHCSIRLGIGIPTFAMGPDVDLACNELAISASELRVYTDRRQDQEVVPYEVFLEARSYRAMHGEPKIGRYGTGQFGVRWPSVAYPWVSHEVKDRLATTSDPRIAATFLHLRRILRRFRKHSGVGLSAGQALVNNVAVGNSRDDAQLLDYLLSQDILRRYERLYVLQEGVAESRGLNYTDMQQATVNEGLTRLLRDFLRHVDGGGGM